MFAIGYGSSFFRHHYIFGLFICFSLSLYHNFTFDFPLKQVENRQQKHWSESVFQNHRFIRKGKVE